MVIFSRQTGKPARNMATTSMPPHGALQPITISSRCRSYPQFAHMPPCLSMLLCTSSQSSSSSFRMLAYAFIDDRTCRPWKLKSAHPQSCRLTPARSDEHGQDDEHLDALASKAHDGDGYLGPQVSGVQDLSELVLGGRGLVSDCDRGTTPSDAYPRRNVDLTSSSAPSASKGLESHNGSSLSRAHMGATDARLPLRRDP